MKHPELPREALLFAPSRASGRTVLKIAATPRLGLYISAFSHPLLRIPSYHAQTYHYSIIENDLTSRSERHHSLQPHTAQSGATGHKDNTHNTLISSTYQHHPFQPNMPNNRRRGGRRPGANNVKKEEKCTCEWRTKTDNNGYQYNALVGPCCRKTCSYWHIYDKKR